MTIELKNFYEGNGVIFSKEDYFIHNKKAEKQIDLTLTDVINAETILDSTTNNIFFSDSLKLNEIQSERRKYNRQYWGIETQSGDKVLIMYIFNFSAPELIEYYKEWDKGFFFSTDPFYSRNTRIYWINLTKEKLEEGSWPLELSHKNCEE